MEELEAAHMCLEDEIRFKIRGAGLPLPEVEWLNGSKVVNNHERYTVGRPEDDLYDIVLKDIHMEDYGKVHERNLSISSVSFLLVYRSVQLLRIW